MTAAPVGIVVATRNRRAQVLATLSRLQDLPGSPPIVVVDDASQDGTAEAVATAYSRVRLIALAESRGAAARNVGVAQLRTPLVAFADDDSWWAHDALGRAATVFERHPRLGLLAARVLVGEQGRTDPTCALMAASPLPRATDLPGPPVLGFIACGAIARREALVAAGGFSSRYRIGGEEELLAIDLRVAGWGLAYVDDVVAHHHPVGGRAARPGRARLQRRNAVWSAWLRRPARRAARTTASTALAAPMATLAALTGASWVLRERRVVPADVERELRLLERQRHGARDHGMPEL